MIRIGEPPDDDVDPLLYSAAPVNESPLRFEVAEVLDGDTFRGRVIGWPRHRLLSRLSVRVLGIDTPERKDARPSIAALAHSATLALRDLLSTGETVNLTCVRWDKYGGRLLAAAEVSGVSVAAEMIRLGFALDYWGVGPKPTWDSIGEAK